MVFGWKGGTTGFAEKGGAVFEGVIKDFSCSAEGAEGAVEGSGEGVAADATSSEEQHDFGSEDWAHVVGFARGVKEPKTKNARTISAILKNIDFPPFYCFLSWASPKPVSQSFRSKISKSKWTLPINSQKHSF